MYQHLSRGDYARNVGELLNKMTTHVGVGNDANQTSPSAGSGKTQGSVVFNETTESTTNRLKDMGVDNMARNLLAFFSATFPFPHFF